MRKYPYQETLGQLTDLLGVPSCHKPLECEEGIMPISFIPLRGIEAEVISVTRWTRLHLRLV